MLAPDAVRSGAVVNFGAGGGGGRRRPPETSRNVSCLDTLQSDLRPHRLYFEESPTSDISLIIAFMQQEDVEQKIVGVSKPVWQYITAFSD